VKVRRTADTALAGGLPGRGRLRARDGLALLAAALIPVVSFLAIFPLVPNIPKWDQWGLLPVWKVYFAGENPLPLLLQPYNGHVNFLPRMIFFGTGLLTEWNVRVEVVGIYLAAAGALLVLVLMLRDSGERMLPIAWLAALQVFTLAQIGSFVAGFMFANQLQQTASLLTVYLLGGPAIDNRRLLGAGVAATVAASSWGPGLAAWLVGAVLIASHGRSRRGAFAAWAVATVLATVMLWRAASTVDMGRYLPWEATNALPFALATIGKSVALSPAPGLPLAIGLGGLAVGAFGMALLWVATQGRRALVRRWGSLGLLALTSAALVGYGRAFAPLERSLASHYATPTYPLVLATIVLVLAGCAHVGRSASGWRRPAAAVAGVAVVVAATCQPLVVSWRAFDSYRSWQPAMTRGVERLVSGTITDEEIRRQFHPNPTLVRRGTEILREHRLSWFATAAER
jgi:hypothetical protein